MSFYNKVITKYAELEKLLKEYDDEEISNPRYRNAYKKALQHLEESLKWFAVADRVRRLIYLENNCHPEINDCPIDDILECIKLYCDEKAKKYFLGGSF